MGVTNDIERRMYEHKSGKGSIFTGKYNLIDLLYFEEVFDFNKAIEREKELKNWRRKWKEELIEQDNPGFIDLARDWFSEEEKKEFV